MTYWNHLGWRDPYSFEAATQRQQRYVALGISPEVYTPALIVDGKELEAGFCLAARNIPNIDVLPIQGINVYDILRRTKLVLTKAALDALEARFA